MRTSLAAGSLLIALASTSFAAEPSPFEKRLLEIAQEYTKYGRVDDEARWAPELCRLPRPSTARFSQSDDPATHGEKLYFLFAKDRAAYVKLASTPAATNQVIVKEAWKAQEAAAGEKPKPIAPRDAALKPSSGDPFARSGAILPYASKDGKLYKAHEKSGLYIMYRLDPKTEGTDDGWVYGTVTPGGKQVTSSGRIESCMKCHQDAPHGRLFGLPSEKKPN